MGVLELTLWKKSLIVAVGFFTSVGVLTGLIPLGIFDRMVPRDPLDYAFLGLTSLLAGAYVLQRSRLEDCGGDGCAYAGGLGGFLAVACPHCNAVLVFLFGSSWLATYVDPIRPVIGGLAVTTLFGILYVRHRRTRNAD